MSKSRCAYCRGVPRGPAKNHQTMKRMGNTASNRLYNPRNAKPAIPIDIDEVDGVMERFIRQKYESKVLGNDSQPSSRNHTGSTSSGDQPPALPPKPHKRFHFGLRAASSTFPSSRHEKSPPTSPGTLGGFGREPSPPPRNKPSRIFGTEVGASRDDYYKAKMADLKDMGFLDEKRNMTILKGLNGNVDRAVEELVRLGEASRDGRRPSLSPTWAELPRNTNGLSITRTRMSVSGKAGASPDKVVNHDKSLPPSPTSQKEFQMQQRVASVQPSFNPFLQQAQTQSIDQAFEGLQISQQQPQHLQAPTLPPQLFPNSTGGYGSQQNHGGHNPFLPTFAPPMPQNYSQFTAPTTFQAHDQQLFAPEQEQQFGVQPPNPFLRQSRSQILQPSNPFEVQHQPTGFPAQPQQLQQSYPSPFAAQPTSTMSPFTPQAASMASPFGTQPPSTAYPFNAQSSTASSHYGAPLVTTQSHFAGQSATPTPSSTQSASAGSSFATQAPTTHYSVSTQPGAISSPFARQPTSSSPFSAQAQTTQQQTNPFQQTTGYQQGFTPQQQPQAQIQQQHPDPNAQTFVPNTYTAHPAFQPNPQQHQYYQQPTQPLQPRFDKTSILALYNMPQLAPARPEIPTNAPTAPTGSQAVAGAAHTKAPQRSVTMPVGALQNQGQMPPAAGSHNPFAADATAGAAPPAAQNGFGHASNESVDFAALMMGGRHSPDAFAGLSARLR